MLHPRDMQLIKEIHNTKKSEASARAALNKIGADQRKFIFLGRNRVQTHDSSYFLLTRAPVTVYKKVHGKGTEYIATLIIPPDAIIRFDTDYRRKCRTNVAYCDSIRKYGYNSDINNYEMIGPSFQHARSGHEPTFVYRPGLIILPKQTFHYGPDECASGVHFFFQMLDAAVY